MPDAQESHRQYRLGTELKSAWIRNRETYRHEHAAECYEKAIEAHPSNLLAYRWLAFELRHMNQFEEAAKVIERGLRAGGWPDEINSLLTVDYTTEELHEELWHELGLIYADSGESSKAIKAFEQSIQLGVSVGKGPGLALSKRCRDAVLSGRYNPSEYRLGMEPPGKSASHKAARRGCLGGSAVAVLLFFALFWCLGTAVALF